MLKIYLASPYSDPSAARREQRYRRAVYASGELMKMGHAVYSPIVHNHPIAEEHDLPTGWEYWANIDRAFLGWADLLVVLCLPGWVDSKGVDAEILIAHELGTRVLLWREGEDAPDVS